jgi:hypothetical protein
LPVPSISLSQGSSQVGCCSLQPSRHHFSDRNESATYIWIAIEILACSLKPNQ